MASQDKRTYQFGPFRVDTVKRRLLRDGKVLPLTPKAFDTLLVLVENCGQVVEKDQLMEKVWQGIAVEENNLTQNISALRKALGERREEPQYIFTVQGQGYRFVATIQELQEENAGSVTVVAEKPIPISEARETVIQESRSQSPEFPLTVAPENHSVNDRSRWGKVLASSLLVAGLACAAFYYWSSRSPRRVEANAKLNSIAVLPFKPLVREERDDYLDAGLADALITKLSNIRQIVVRPTSAVLKYANSDNTPAEIGRQLQVDAILHGLLQKSADRLRITVQLIRVSDGAPLWGHTFDEKFTDVFAVEDRVSEKVAQAMLPTLAESQKEKLSRHYTENMEAYESYIKGRYYWNKRTTEGVKKAVEYFQDAILKDPQYALAYAGLADSFTTLVILDDIRPQDIMPKAKSAAMKAVELDDELAEGHASLGYVKHRYEWDWAGAEREFKRAIELNPQYATAHQWYGWYLISLASFDEALAEFKRAQQLDPLSLYVNLTLGAPFFYSRQYDKAIEQDKRVLEMDANFPLAHRWLAKAYEQKGMYEEAAAEFQKYMKYQNGDIAQAPALGYVYALAGKLSEARKVLDELQAASKKRYVQPYGLASIYAGLGNKDQAFQMLEKEYEDHGDSLIFLQVEQRFDGLRSDPRFNDLLQRVGFPK